MVAQQTWSTTFRKALPQVADVGYAVGSLGVSATMLHNWLDPHSYWRTPDAWAYGLLALIYLPLALRRRAPLPVLGSTAACVLCYFTLGYYHAVGVIGPGLAFYTVAALRPRKVVAKCAAATLLVLLWGTRLAEPGIGPVSVAFVTMMVVVIWVTGDRSRRLVERGERLSALSEQLARQQEEKAQLAVTEERMKIARELHDVVAHHVSVISVQAGLAGYVFTTDPPTARKALDTISGSTREAMAEMRRMLVLLRQGAEQSRQVQRGGEPRDLDASLGLGQLEPLVQRVRDAAVPVDVRITGTAYALPPGVDLCIYRVVQEALTNVMKHAPSANATVLVHYDEAEIHVRVADDGQQRVSANVPVKSAAHGLIGMHERVSVYGGTVTAGPGPGGGFEVSLTVPVPRDR
ncbi:sensor histidine kinase [Streptomyces sp. NBC_00258]|uniref:sensor histidine kinase n=1 Tax=Streptomyces sp. NBC_00258 TaxID=2903642 RepID=UPI002E27B71E|nr:sensor histidine kinase [Streptomyces sp. NBC_00258]